MLRFLLLLFVCICSVAFSISAFGVVGCTIAMWIIALTLISAIRPAYSAVMPIAVVFLLVTGTALWYFLPTVSVATEFTRQQVCKNKLELIGQALLDYHDQHGNFPPAYLADEQGKPMHSWRVLILPQLEYQDIYRRYRFDEPWDGPSNRVLAQEFPSIYACPSTHTNIETEHGMTDYVAITGPNAAWHGDKPRRLKEFKDNGSNTIGVAEIKNSDIHWMQPHDIALNKALSGDHSSSNAIGSQHYTSGLFFDRLSMPGNVAYVDGHAEFLDRWPSQDEMRALLTLDGINAGESNARAGRQAIRVHWMRCAAIACLLMSIGMAVFMKKMPSKT